MLLVQKPGKLFPFSAHLLVPGAFSLPVPWIALGFPGKMVLQIRSNRFVGFPCPFQDHAQEVPGGTVVRVRHIWQVEPPHAEGRARATAHG
jgi:hypothetical protein